MKGQWQLTDEELGDAGDDGRTMETVALSGGVGHVRCEAEHKTESAA